MGAREIERDGDGDGEREREREREGGGARGGEIYSPRLLRLFLSGHDGNIS